jgi:antitoxin PrlF
MKTQLSKDWQVTIPSEVRHRLGLREGDELIVIVTDSEIRLRPIKKRRLRDFRGILPATRAYPGKAAIRKAVAESLANELSEPES